MRRALLVLLLAGPALTQDRAAVERDFDAWLEASVWPRAEAAGVSRAAFDASLGGVALDWDLPGLVPPGAVAPQGAQAEFAAPGAYFDGAEATARVGRDMAQRHADTLAAVEAATGVPAHVLLAVWGRESAYGRADLPHDALRVLATRAFMDPRAPFFAEELVAALRIVEEGHAPPGALRGSAAGALGQPQFMPTSFLAFAADGDGDGRADIWGSEADALLSIGTYLAQHGWEPGRDWGFEVAVPPALSCALEGPDQGRTVTEWEALGVARANGRPFPAHERAGEAFLVMPAGRHGPAFLATPNFLALKEYNTSDLYALFVGHVGDRIAFGAEGFAGAWDDVAGASRAEVARIQRALGALGHDTGGADGLAGFRTRRALGRWQEASGEAPTCWPGPGMAEALAP